MTAADSVFSGKFSLLHQMRMASLSQETNPLCVWQPRQKGGGEFWMNQIRCSHRSPFFLVDVVQQFKSMIFFAFLISCDPICVHGTLNLIDDCNTLSTQPFTDLIFLMGDCIDLVIHPTGLYSQMRSYMADQNM